jgi:PTH1 family peptidyl-tRNA hydrolase
MKLVIGLGNPGLKYKKTKHNVGFLALDLYAKKHKLKFKKDNKFKGEWLKDGNLLLLKPHTFMNLSGESVQAIMNFYDLDIVDILVVYDDLSLPLGKIRLREKGSAGGHNGVKSIIQHLKTQDFQRLKVGIDTNPLIETKNYVLSKFDKKEWLTIEKSLETISHIIEDFKNKKSFVNIMNTYN